MNLFSISHNSFYRRGYPWINHIASGMAQTQTCRACGEQQRFCTGDIEVTLEPRKGVTWPDVLGCGACPLFIVSVHVLKAWQFEKLADIPYYQVKLIGKIPAKLENKEPPAYFWIDGAKLQGAKYDFEASGYVNARICPECCRLYHDVSVTHKLQHSRKFPTVLNSWSGANVFTTNFSPYRFFCTSKILDCARKYKLTNFRFIPIEEGDAPESEGVKYLKES